MPPRSTKTVTPYWQTKDSRTVRLWQGNAVDVLRSMPSTSVQMCVTSPPYYGLRKYHGTNHEEIGCEKTPEEYVAKLVAVFCEVKRVLRPDGMVFLNLGDSYGGKIGCVISSKFAGNEPKKNALKEFHDNHTPPPNELPNGNLLGIPWKVAFALQADGWILRQDNIWCLSGGTWVYARTQKGDMPMMIRDMTRLDPATVKLWNGEKWTQLLGMSKTARKSTEIELVLRSGERISCTPTHRFPTSRGLLEAGKIRIGDALTRTWLPEPDNCPYPEHLGEDAAWFAGLYIAEGSHSNNTIQIAGHVKEESRWLRVKRIAESYGGSATRTIAGNCMNIRVYGKLLNAILEQLVGGKTAKDKCVATVCWRYSDKFLKSMLEGYLSGDGHWEENNNRWRLGFTRNYNLERDLRTICARLGYHIILKPSSVPYDGKLVPTFRGEIRVERSGHGSEKDSCTVIEIRKARCREVYDIGVADEPHLFALASGILTHNSKKNPMPESVQNRCTKSHEYIFMLTLSTKYYCDMEAVKGKGRGGDYHSKSDHKYMSHDKEIGSRQHLHKRNGDLVLDANKRDVWSGNEENALLQWLAENHPKTLDQFLAEKRNKLDVWWLSTKGYKGKHFATFSPDLVESCIKMGTSEKGCCAECRTPWVRKTDKVGGKQTTGGEKANRDRSYQWSRNGLSDAGSTLDSGIPKVVTVGWEKNCACSTEETKPCTVLDPFLGSGTTVLTALDLGRNGWGIDLSEDYLKDHAIKRIRRKLFHNPLTVDLLD